MKIVFMGTPDFAVGALTALLEAGHEITAVVTQPDKPKGRGKEVQMPPVKECALSHGIPVLQPVKIKAPEAVAGLRERAADVFVVAAFGQLLSEEILSMPRYGCLNIHASLLPKYRGASPIQWAILNGDRETGVTIMQMDKGMDTGDMLLKEAVPIGEKETADSLHDRLKETGAKLIVRALSLLEKGELKPQKQSEADASYVSLLRKSLGEINWETSAVCIDRLVRGLNSWPSAYTYYNGKILKIWEAEPVKALKGGEPGTVAAVEKEAFYVNTGEGQLRVTKVQPEGKKRMEVKDFLLGYPMEPGIRLEGKAQAP